MKKLLLVMVIMFSASVFLQASSPTYGSIREERLTRRECKKRVLAGYCKINEKLMEQSFVGIKVNSKIPEKLNFCEYQKLARAQEFRIMEFLADKAASGDLTVEEGLANYGFTGLLINSKRGINESVSFRISNLYFREFCRTHLLAPQEKLEIRLPAGEYLVEVFMGNYFVGSVVCQVHPAISKSVYGKNYYFWAEKRL